MEKSLTVNNYSLQSYASDLQAKLQFCKLLLQSALCPKSFRSEGDVLACIIYGEEIGFTPMQALQSLYIVNGVPTLGAAGIKALIIKAGGHFETISWDSKHCKLKCFRGDWVEEFEYTIEDAQRAKLAGKDNWQNHPKQMLYARCIAVLGRNMYADALKGIQSKEVMQDDGRQEDELVLEEVQEPLKIEQKFDKFTYDTKLIKDESKMMAAQKFCEENKGYFESLGEGVYRSIIDSKKLANCKVGEQNATV